MLGAGAAPGCVHAQKIERRTVDPTPGEDYGQQHRDARHRARDLAQGYGRQGRRHVALEDQGHRQKGNDAGDQSIGQQSLETELGDQNRADREERGIESRVESDDPATQRVRGQRYQSRLAANEQRCGRHAVHEPHRIPGQHRRNDRETDDQQRGHQHGANGRAAQADSRGQERSREAAKDVTDRASRSDRANGRRRIA